MPKITINKTVFWEANGRVMEGKVKNIMSDHAVVNAEGTNYLVRKAVLSMKALSKNAENAKRTIVASTSDN